MTVWDFSKWDTWERMERRAAADALREVLAYWPYDQDEASPDIPQDFNAWADALTRAFQSETLGLPRWALKDREVGNAAYLNAMHAYYRTCLQQLKYHIKQRIDSTGKLPRQTLPPASPGTVLTMRRNREGQGK